MAPIVLRAVKLIDRPIHGNSDLSFKEVATDAILLRIIVIIIVNNALKAQ